MTYREYYAGVALQSLATRTDSEERAAKTAVLYAEALCKALDVDPHGETLYNLSASVSVEGDVTTRQAYDR